MEKNNWIEVCQYIFYNITYKESFTLPSCKDEKEFHTIIEKVLNVNENNNIWPSITYANINNNADELKKYIAIDDDGDIIPLDEDKKIIIPPIIFPIVQKDSDDNIQYIKCGVIYFKADHYEIYEFNSNVNHKNKTVAHYQSIAYEDATSSDGGTEFYFVHTENLITVVNNLISVGIDSNYNPINTPFDGQIVKSAYIVNIIFAIAYIKFDELIATETELIATETKLIATETEFLEAVIDNIKKSIRTYVASYTTQYNNALRYLKYESISDTLDKYSIVLSNTTYSHSKFSDTTFIKQFKEYFSDSAALSSYFANINNIKENEDEMINKILNAINPIIFVDSGTVIKEGDIKDAALISILCCEVQQITDYYNNHPEDEISKHILQLIKQHTKEFDDYSNLLSTGAVWLNKAYMTLTSIDKLKPDAYYYKYATFYNNNKTSNPNIKRIRESLGLYKDLKIQHTIFNGIINKIISGSNIELCSMKQMYDVILPLIKNIKKSDRKFENILVDTEPPKEIMNTNLKCNSDMVSEVSVVRFEYNNNDKKYEHADKDNILDYCYRINDVCEYSEGNIKYTYFKCNDNIFYFVNNLLMFMKHANSFYYLSNANDDITDDSRFYKAYKIADKLTIKLTRKGTLDVKINSITDVLKLSCLFKQLRGGIVKDSEDIQVYQRLNNIMAADKYHLTSIKFWKNIHSAISKQLLLYGLIKPTYSLIVAPSKGIFGMDMLSPNTNPLFTLSVIKTTPGGYIVDTNDYYIEDALFDYHHLINNLSTLGNNKLNDYIYFKWIYSDATDNTNIVNYANNINNKNIDDVEIIIEEVKKPITLHDLLLIMITIFDNINESNKDTLEPILEALSIHINKIKNYVMHISHYSKVYNTVGYYILCYIALVYDSYYNNATADRQFGNESFNESYVYKTLNVLYGISNKLISSAEPIYIGTTKYVDNNIEGKDKNNTSLLIDKMIFEVYFNGIMSDINYDTAIDIYTNNNPTNQNIYTIDMGRGKSNVITPFLIFKHIISAEINNDQQIVSAVIVPEHLKKQTQSIISSFAKLFRPYYDNNQELSKIKVYSDNDVKKIYKLTLNCECGKTDNQQENTYNTPFEGAYVIFDEIDTLMDPSKNNYNIECSRSNNVDVMNKISTLVDCAFNNYIKILDGSTDEFICGNDDIIKQTYKSDITFTDVNKYVSYRDYGFGSFQNNFIPYAVPYASIDDPIERSYFNDLGLTIALTAKLYIDPSCMKQIHLDNLRDFIIDEYFRYYVDNIDVLNKLPTLQDQKDLFNEAFNKYLTHKDMTIFKDNTKWLLELFKFVVNDNIKIMDKYINTSFISIANNKFLPNCKITLFSGTTNVKYFFDFIGNKDNENLLDKTSFDFKLKDEDSKLLKGSRKDRMTKQIAEHKFMENATMHIITPLNSINELIDYIVNNGYNAFIDVVGILYKYSINEFITALSNKLKSDKLDYNYIAFTNKYNERKLWDIKNDREIDYDPLITESEHLKIFYFYDNKHTVGIDIKQSKLVEIKGLVSFGKNITYEKLIQGCKRLRHLDDVNAKQSVEFIGVGKDKIDSMTKIANKDKKEFSLLEIVNMSSEAKNSTFELMLYNQLVQYFIQQHYKDNKTNPLMTSIYATLTGEEKELRFKRCIYEQAKEYCYCDKDLSNKLGIDISKTEKIINLNKLMYVRSSGISRETEMEMETEAAKDVDVVEQFKNIPYSISINVDIDNNFLIINNNIKGEFTNIIQRSFIKGDVYIFVQSDLTTYEAIHYTRFTIDNKIQCIVFSNYYKQDGKCNKCSKFNNDMDCIIDISTIKKFDDEDEMKTIGQICYELLIIRKFYKSTSDMVNTPSSALCIGRNINRYATKLYDNYTDKDKGKDKNIVVKTFDISYNNVNHKLADSKYKAVINDDKFNSGFDIIFNNIKYITIMPSTNNEYVLDDIHIRFNDNKLLSYLRDYNKRGAAIIITKNTLGKYYKDDVYGYSIMCEKCSEFKWYDINKNFDKVDEIVDNNKIYEIVKTIYASSLCNYDNRETVDKVLLINSPIDELNTGAKDFVPTRKNKK